MPYFRWHALEADDHVATGTEFCRSAELLGTRLTKRGLVKILAISEQPLSAFSLISDEERALFFQQLGSLIRAGIPVVDALGVCQKTTQNRLFQEVIEDSKAAVNEGIALSAVCACHHDFFPLFACQLLQAGEELGRLGQTCIDLAQHYDSLHQFAKRVRAALVVPLLTLACFCIVFVLIFGFVIPRLSVLIRGLRVPLSGTTEFIFTVADWLSSGGFITLGIICVVILFVIRWLLRANRRKGGWGQWILLVPFFNTWVCELTTAAFFRTLGSLLEGGVDVAKALTMACLGVASDPLRVRYERVAQAVMAGRSLGQSFIDEHMQLPPLCHALIEVGESTGKLGTLLLQCASEYDQRLSNRLQLFSTVIQPIMLLVLGLGVACVMFALYEPLFSIGSMVG